MTSTNRLGFFCMFTALAVGACGFAQRATAVGVIYDENFGGLSTNNLNGTLPDVDNNGGGNTWLAYSGYKENGLMPTTTAQGAWLPFTPVAGNTYALSTSMTGISATGTTSNSWFAMGFAKALPTPANAEAAGTLNRFIETPTVGRAWMFYRPTTVATNMIQLGNATSGTGAGPQSPAAWSDTSLSGPGDIDMKIVLDTNPAIWTATFYAKRPASASYTQVSSGALSLLAQDIAGIGFTRTSNAAGTVMSGTITNFTLETLPQVLAGDVNSDGHVDILDFNVIRDHLFQSGARAQGDLTGDGFVDFSDFRSWKSAPPSGAGAVFDAAIPEPASALLVMIATAGSLLVGRRRRGVASQQNL